MSRRIALFIAVSMAFASLAQNASAAPDRVALVIGNGAYVNAGKLANPPNDAADVAAALRKLGFDVVEGRDLDKRGMEAKIIEFSRKLDRAGIALFFYAGHGMQVGGRNHLVPIDAKLERAGDLSFETLDVSQVLAQMEAEKRINLVFLDACRDNPLARSFSRTLGTRSAAVGNGLASIQGAIGTMIVYATQPDNVALDGDGTRNSPFTAALLRHIATPGLEIRSMMTRVRADVLTATREKQVPWDHSSLTSEVTLTPALPLAVIPAPASPGADEIAWSFLKDTNDASQLRRFVEQYPLSSRRNDAAARLLKLERDKVAALPGPAVPPTVGFGRSSSFDPGVVYTSAADISVDRKITSAESCRDLCLVTPSCLLWQFAKEPAVCHLSRSVGSITSTRSPDYVSGRISMRTAADTTTPPASRRIVVNFDALNAFGQASGVGDKALADYLAKFGIKLVASTAQRIAAFDDRNVYEGKAVKASSGRGVLMQQGGNPVSYTLEFTTPLKSISLDRVALIAGPSGITHPIWKAVAHNTADQVVGSVGEDVIRSYSDIAAKTFTLSGPGIKRLVVTGDHQGFAAFSSLVLDNLVLVTE